MGAAKHNSRRQPEERTFYVGSLIHLLFKYGRYYTLGVLSSGSSGFFITAAILFAPHVADALLVRNNVAPQVRQSTHVSRSDHFWQVPSPENQAKGGRNPAIIPGEGWSRYIRKGVPVSPLTLSVQR
jgi:hypothetical protein